jgi:PTH1 family peptidyl-tRNA hydrolase
MKMIVGLGNPGREYEKTRHNIGFMVLDELVRRAAPVPSRSRSRFKSELIDATVGGERVVLLKPQTYMNLSGHALRETAGWYKIARTDILVIYDELDLPFGSIRLRGEGSAGGHNGMKSIVEQLGGNAIPRMRLGIGRGRGVAVAQVLSRFAPDEERELPEILAAAADCAALWVREGIVAAGNRCNRKPTPPPEPDPAPVAVRAAAESTPA